MAVATQAKTARPTQAQPAQNQGAVALLAPPRLLPPPQDILQKYEVDNQGWRTLVESIFPAAKTPTSVIMALDYCARRRLDVFKHPVHIVPIWNSQAGENGKGAMVETIWPGINELRTTAIRTGQYAGMDVPTFGPIKTQTFKGKIKKWAQGGAQWEPVEATVAYPEWCQITVYRTLGANRVPFPGPRVYWLETYARLRNDVEVPNSMWEKRANGQLEKCAEAAALRRAFPEELGSDYSIDEIGAFATHSPTDVTDQGSATTEPAPPEPKRADFEPPATPAAPHSEPAGDGQPTATPPAGGNGGGGVSKPEAPAAAPASTKVTDVTDVSEEPPPAEEGLVFEDYKRPGDFFQFADTWVQDQTRTEAELIAFSAFYQEYILKGLAHPKLANDFKETKQFLDNAIVAAEKRGKQALAREPGEEG